MHQQGSLGIRALSAAACLKTVVRGCPLTLVGSPGGSKPRNQNPGLTQKYWEKCTGKRLASLKRHRCSLVYIVRGSQSVCSTVQYSTVRFRGCDPQPTTLNLTSKVMAQSSLRQAFHTRRQRYMSRFKLTIPVGTGQFRFIGAWGWKNPKPNLRDLRLGTNEKASFALGSPARSILARGPVNNL